MGKTAKLGCRWIVLCTVLFLSTGCGDKKEDPLAVALSESNRTIEKLNVDNDRLKEEMSLLQNACDELQSEYDNLKVKETELAQWSRQMAERFGPGLWYFSKTEKPLPYKSIPDATPDRLIAELNDLFKQSQLPRVTLVKISGNTASVQIRQDRQLTQQMGSAGATGYIQAITYTLTSLPNIESVDFTFHEGDHAVPGRYQR